LLKAEILRKTDQQVICVRKNMVFYHQRLVRMQPI